MTITCRTALLLLLAFVLPGLPRASAAAPDIKKPFGAPYKAPAPRAAVKPYKVAPTLANVSNFAQMSRVFNFTPEQKAMLAKNGFVVAPSTEEQLFYVYENNDYLQLPSFITVDSVLQVYHIFYDFSLREVEQKKLLGDLLTLSTSLVESAARQHKAATDPTVREAALRNLAFAAVARKLADPASTVPADVADLVKAELALIEAHAGRDASPIFDTSDVQVDYSQFIPRGHYTRTPELRRYFMGMMWYGLIPFPLENSKSGEADRRSTLQALLLSASLHEKPPSGPPAIEAWDRIYAPTAFYVGVADDITPVEVQTLAVEVFGPTPSLDAFADTARFDRFVAEAAKRFRAPAVAASIGDRVEGTVQRRQFRLMGQRFIPDSRVFQELTYPKVGSGDNRRLMPKGLDVMAALGSERARKILRADTSETSFANYESQSEKMRVEMASLDQAAWTQNLYYAWLWTLKSLLEPAGAGYPSFMQNEAWQDKNLSTALASWSELKHNTVLYGKQSGAECGGDEPPPPPKGYVEPNVELYARLGHLTRISREGLRARALIEADDNVDTAFQQFDDLLMFLQTASEKQLRNEALTREEYDQIRYYGAQLEHLTLSVIDEGLSGWYELQSEADKDMAVIADVHTGGGEALQVGVGHANAIFVVVPVEGKLQLTRGAVFSYYEFHHPAADRLTDEAWQGMLKRNAAPPRPAWMKSFVGGTKLGVKTKDVKVYSSGC